MAGNAVLASRRFRQRNSPQGTEPREGALSEFFDDPAVVVLGEPGAGKTTTFQHGAGDEADAEYTTVRDFLICRPMHWAGKTVYLDGLDEYRARSADGFGALDEIRKVVASADIAKFRLSCRAADWYGELDASALETVVPGGRATVLDLLPLDDDGILAVSSNYVDDPEVFVRDAKDRGLHDLLQNPQTLILLLTAREKGAWPESRTELFETACQVLISEENPIHGRAVSAQIADRDLRRLSAKLCAVILCSGKTGVALSKSAESENHFFVGALHDDVAELQQAAKRRVFQADGPERVLPVHRTIAEFLAGSFLAECVASSLPRLRAMALLVGYDSGTLPDLRGTFAWFATRLREDRTATTRIDPFGILLYGDVQIFSDREKLSLFSQLARLSKNNPWFRSSDRSERPFGALATESLIPEFRRTLNDRSSNPVLVGCVLDALAYGSQLPSLLPTLRAFINRKGVDSRLRRNAIRTYDIVSRGDVRVALRLLQRLDKGEIEDADAELRGALFDRLYPDHLSPSELPRFIVEPPKSFIGSYFYFLKYALIEKSDPEDLAALLDGLVRTNVGANWRNDYYYRELFPPLVIVAAQTFGQNSCVERLYSWFGLAVDEYGHCLWGQDERLEIRKWLNANPGIFVGMLALWLQHLNRKEGVFGFEQFAERLGLGDSSELLLLAIKTVPSSYVGSPQYRALFIIAARAVVFCPSPKSEDWNYLCQQADGDPELLDVLSDLTTCPVQEWRVEHAAERLRERKEKKEARAEANRILRREIAGIKDGSARRLVFHLAKIYHGMYVDVQRDIAPFERMSRFTADDIAQSALVGFDAYTRNSRLAMPVDIGRQHAQGQLLGEGYVVLAAIDEAWKKDPRAILGFGRNTLKSAIAYHYANGQGKTRDWLISLTAMEPALVVDALTGFIDEQLAQKAEHVVGLYDLCRAEEMTCVGRMVLPSLLARHWSTHVQQLRTMLQATYKHVPENEFRELVAGVVKCRRGVKEQVGLWLIYGLLTSPASYETRINTFLAKQPSFVGSVVSIVLENLDQVKEMHGEHTYYQLMSFALDLGMQYFEAKPLVELEPGEEVSRTVAAAIERLAREPSREAASTLHRLLSSKGESTWGDRLRHSIVVQSEHRRQVRFQYPLVSEIENTLCNGAPSGIVDLHALVVDRLRDLRDEIQHGFASAYLDYWNVDQYGRKDEARPENVCRNTLVNRFSRLLEGSCVAVEPEGSHSAGTRSDAKVIFRTSAVPIEIKRHWHRDLWTAPTEQLQDLYMQDPATGGRGVYVVLWFGSDYRSPPAPPAGMASPQSAEELEQELFVVVGEERRDSLVPLVIDVSKP